MTHNELQQKLKDNPDLYLVDIREAAELDETSMIEGANHIPMGRMFIKAAHNELPKESEIVVYCASGTRAGIVAEHLASRGYNISHISEPLKNS